MTFTKAEFEDALKGALITITCGDRSLAKLKYLGLLAGEHTYFIWVAPSGNKRIVIRSSIRADGRSAPTGKNSIRLWLEYFYKNDWFALGKLDAWTTREPGWQQRMATRLQRLWDMALEDTQGATPCNPQRGKPPTTNYRPTTTEQTDHEDWRDHKATHQPQPSLQPVRRLDRMGEYPHTPKRRRQ